MLEKCKDCCCSLFCMSVAEVNGEDFETMANKKDCRKKSFTNADRMRSMSDDELADILYKFAHSHNKPLNKGNLYEWLKQPAKGVPTDETAV